MKNNKLIVAKKILMENDIVIPDDVILRLLHETKQQSEAVYEPNDFVEFSCGMGEMGFGMVTDKTHNWYKVIPYFDGKPCDYEYHVGEGDMRGLSTIEKSLEYECIRKALI